MGGILYEFPGNNLLQERFSPETLLKIIIKFLSQEEVKLVRLDIQTTSWQQTELISPGFLTVREDGWIKLQRACCPLQVFQREGAAMPQFSSILSLSCVFLSVWAWAPCTQPCPLMRWWWEEWWTWRCHGHCALFSTEPPFVPTITIFDKKNHYILDISI